MLSFCVCCECLRKKIVYIARVKHPARNLLSHKYNYILISFYAYIVNYFHLVLIKADQVICKDESELDLKEPY